MTLLTAACAPSMERARVTAYVDPGTPKSLSGLTLSVRPRGSQAASLEWDRSRDRLASELKAMGATVMEPAETEATPWVISFTYGTDGPRMETTERPVMTGRLRRGPPPFFGDPWESQTFIQTTYIHWLVMTLHDGADLGERDPAEIRPISELRVETMDRSPDDAAALPVLLRAAVQAFPGREGSPSVIKVSPPPR